MNNNSPAHTHQISIIWMENCTLPLFMRCPTSISESSTSISESSTPKLITVSRDKLISAMFTIYRHMFVHQCLLHFVYVCVCVCVHLCVCTCKCVLCVYIYVCFVCVCMHKCACVCVLCVHMHTCIRVLCVCA